MQTSSQVRWAFRQGMWSFGVGTPRAFLAASLAYNLRDGIAEKITCPVFAGRAESDEFFRGQQEELMEHLTTPATLASFTDAEGAGAHCQVGAQRLLCARMLDWLDETLAGSEDVPALRRAARAGKDPALLHGYGVAFESRWLVPPARRLSRNSWLCITPIGRHRSGRRSGQAAMAGCSLTTVPVQARRAALVRRAIPPNTELRLAR
jgi:hypothetical protein